MIITAMGTMMRVNSVCLMVGQEQQQHLGHKRICQDPVAVTKEVLTQYAAINIT